MTRPVIILSGPDDPHAFAVAEGIRRKGGDVTIWHTSDFPVSSWESLEFEDDRLRLDIRGMHQTISQPAPATVWNRRLSKTIDVSALHPADRTFGHAQCFDLRRSMVHLLGSDALWINPLLAQSRAMLKPVQMRVAQEAGFNVPRTLYSNDPERIRAFIRRMGGKVVFKQLALVGVWSDGEKRFAPYTTTVGENQLADDPRTAAAPGIFQEILPRAYELRITVMGDRMFVTRLDPPEVENAKVDWRLAVLRGQTEQMKPASIPPEVEQSVRAYMRGMNLVFGCFDLFVTPEGKHVFIECNEAGQFLFVEQETGEAVLDAFVAFLMQGTPHFEWRETPDSLRLEDIWKVAQQQSAEAQKLHAVGVRTNFYEGAAATESV